MSDKRGDAGLTPEIRHSLRLIEESRRLLAESRRVLGPTCDERRRQPSEAPQPDSPQRQIPPPKGG